MVGEGGGEREVVAGCVAGGKNAGRVDVSPVAPDLDYAIHGLEWPNLPGFGVLGRVTARLSVLIEVFGGGLVEDVAGSPAEPAVVTHVLVAVVLQRVPAGSAVDRFPDGWQAH